MLKINQTFQSENIPGSSFYGGLGRAFHRNEYQWILGLEQLMDITTPFWKNTAQFYIETFNKSITNDAWRMWDGENSLSALFLEKDSSMLMVPLIISSIYVKSLFILP